VNPLIILVIGLTVLLGTALAALRAILANIVERRHLDTRLLQLHAPVGGLAEPARRAGNPAELHAGAPHMLHIALSRADIKLQPSGVMTAWLAIAALCATIGVLWGWVASVATLVTIGLAITQGFRLLSRYRLSGLLDGLPSLLDNTRQLLLVGNSFQQALIEAVGHSDPAVQRYFGRLLRRMQHGAAVNDGLTWLAESIELAELHMFAIAVQTNLRYGSRISVVLTNLTQILRDRSRVERELRSSTAETRLSALVLGLLPVAGGAMIGFINPQYVQFFLTTPQGHHLILIAGGLELAGVLVMRRIMRLDF
jgi:tight adherence protein B